MISSDWPPSPAAISRCFLSSRFASRSSRSVARRTLLVAGSRQHPGGGGLLVYLGILPPTRPARASSPGPRRRLLSEVLSLAAPLHLAELHRSRSAFTRSPRRHLAPPRPPSPPAVEPTGAGALRSQCPCGFAPCSPVGSARWVVTVSRLQAATRSSTGSRAARARRRASCAARFSVRSEIPWRRRACSDRPSRASRRRPSTASGSSTACSVLPPGSRAPSDVGAVDVVGDLDEHHPRRLDRPPVSGSTVPGSTIALDPVALDRAVPRPVRLRLRDQPQIGLVGARPR